MNKKKIPLVSICCITYNQEKYIHAAIEGFLMQRTTFPIEIIIHDDASTDGTASIIKEYQERHPELIIPILQTENQFSKGIGRLLNIVFSRARGKYIAHCEGDDYWTDPYKLQKQVDFLEKEPLYGLVHTDADIFLTKEDRRIRKYNFTNNIVIPTNNVFENTLMSKYPIFTCTVLFRQELLETINLDEYTRFKMGDSFLWLEFARNTLFKYFNEVTAVRQKLEESATQSKDYKKLISFRQSGYELYLFMIQKYNVSNDIVKIVHLNSNRVILALAAKNNDSILVRQCYCNLVEQCGKAAVNIKDYVYYLISYLPYGLKVITLCQSIYSFIKHQLKDLQKVTLTRHDIKNEKR